MLRIFSDFSAQLDAFVLHSSSGKASYTIQEAFVDGEAAAQGAGFLVTPRPRLKDADTLT